MLFYAVCVCACNCVCKTYVCVYVTTPTALGGRWSFHSASSSLLGCAPPITLLLVYLIGQFWGGFCAVEYICVGVGLDWASLGKMAGYLLDFV